VSARRAAAQARRQAERQGIDHTTGEIRCPLELRTCVVEDWLTSTDAGTSRELLELRAWGRWRRARSDYASERGGDVVTLCGPYRRPAWRDEQRWSSPDLWKPT
jgi:hypothetical protein